jgi:hypothetical protein
MSGFNPTVAIINARSLLPGDSSLQELRRWIRGIDQGNENGLIADNQTSFCPAAWCYDRKLNIVIFFCEYVGRLS